MFVTRAFSVTSSHFVGSLQLDVDMWPCRLGQNNKRDVQKLSKSVTAMKLQTSDIPDCLCDICASNKLNRKPACSMTVPRKSSKLKFVYSDVRGPTETTSLVGQSYIVSRKF